MSKSPPQVIPRKSSGVRVMLAAGEQRPPDQGASGESNHRPLPNADREIEILNHCFQDVERFMTRLQKAAEAQIVLNQRKKKSTRKSKTNENQDGDLLTTKAIPPTNEEFVDIFQKIKYSICLLDRLKSSISQPDAPELLHHIFVPLKLIVKTTGGPTLGASVTSPGMTSGAVSLLQQHLNEEEKELWTSLGTNWTSPCLDSSKTLPPYSPVFLDGWQPRACDSTGQPLQDPIQLQHKQDAVRESRKKQSLQEQAQHANENHGAGADKVDGNGLTQNTERLYCCSYDFVARNSSELSVLQGETLEVIESSKRWWKCQNRFGQVGFVPYNILEPLSAVNNARRDNPKKAAPADRTKCYSYTPSSSEGTSPTARGLAVRPQSMVLPSKPMSGEEGDRVLVVNNELVQRLAKRQSSVDQQPTLVLKNRSPPAEVTAWLTAQNFSQQTVECLGILTGAQLFCLTKDELCTVVPDEGAKVHSSVQRQMALLEDRDKTSETD